MALGGGIYFIKNTALWTIKKRKLLLHHRRRDGRASQLEDETGIGDPGEVYPPPGGQTCAARAAAAAQADAAPALAVRPAAGQPTRQHTPASPIRLRKGAPPPPKRRGQRRAPRRPPRPLGPLVGKKEIVKETESASHNSES